MKPDSSLSLTLASLPIGSAAQILELQGAGPSDSPGTLDLIGRLSELGFVPGVSVSVVRRAPLGDPLVVRIMGYELCIRTSDAARILIGPAGSLP